jgi:hypothetical protein
LHSQGTIQDGIGSVAITELPAKHKKLGLTMMEGSLGVEVRVEGVNSIQIFPYTALQRYDVVSESDEKPAPATMRVLKAANA